MGHQAGHASVAIQERVNPQQPVVSRCRRKNRFGFSESAVDPLEALQKAHGRARTDGDMLSNLDIAPPDGRVSDLVEKC
jgi:hypothetical protein